MLIMPSRTVFALSLCLALTSLAQARPDDPAVLDKIEVKGFPFRYQASDPSSAMKTETALKDTPQAVTVVTEQQIDDQSLHGMSDILRYVPGVGMAQGEGHRDAPVMRGNTSTGDFFTDGIRDDIQYFRDLYNVSQVEVLKGPNAMVFGRGGSGGIINRVSKQADGGHHQAFSIQAGSADFLRAEADVGDALSDTVAYRFNAMIENAGSFRNDVSSNLRGFAPGMTFGIDANTRVVLSAELFSDIRTVDRGIPSYLGKPLDTEPSLFFGNADDSHADADATSFDVLVEHDMDGAVLRSRTRIADYGKFYQNVYPGAVNVGGTGVEILAYNIRTDRTNVFNQTDYVVDILYDDVTHRLVVGAELGRQNTANFRETGYFGSIGSTQTSELAAIENPAPILPVHFRQSASDADNQGTAETAALYVQDQIHLGDRWQIIAGLRLDRFHMDFHNKRNATRIETTDTRLSPRAGVIYSPSEAISGYASYAESFVPRAGDQLASLTPNTANLAPEVFVSTEIGMKWQLSKGLFTSVAVYQLDRNNVAVTDPANPMQTLLIDAQRSRGLEWEIGGNISRTLQIVAGYAYQEAELTHALSTSVPAGTVLPLVPEHSGYVWSRWDISAHWGLGLGINGRGKVYTTASNKVSLPGFSRLDAAIYYKASEYLKLQANIENMADKRYYPSAHNDNNISIGTPREVKLSMHLDF
jgi:catecholate siderophore receptor